MASQGLTRHGSPGAFTYRTPSGRILRDAVALERIRKLAIPPAWTDVWIAANPEADLQATGRDAKGRKQYRYHAGWTARRDQAKFDRLLSFGRALPAIRRRVARDLTATPLSRPRVIATLVALLERTHIRIGNPEYARANGSYGLTTLRNEHVKIRGPEVEFSFTGKSGIDHTIRVNDAKLAGEIRRCRSVSDETLFDYVDERGRTRRVRSADVNAYLTAAAGYRVTAKDFRTWWGTVAAAVRLRDIGPAPTRTAARKIVCGVLDEVAEQLGNTRAICRKSYVHPAILDLYLTPATGRAPEARPVTIRGLSRDEQFVVACLSAASARRRPRRGTRAA